MTNRIYHLAAAIMLGFAIVSLGLVYWQVLRADSLRDRADNPRVAEAVRRADRGAILDRHGRILARTQRQPDGTGRRVYTTPSLSHVIGYASPRFGQAGLERTYNGHLSGRDGQDLVSSVLTGLSLMQPEGNDLVLTIDLDLQEATAKALGMRPGAAVVLDARTGAVLAMVSQPTYDANEIERQGEALNRDSTRPLLNRAAQGLYPPGSTFKTVTGVAALDSGTIKPSDRFTCIGEFVVNGRPIKCGNVPGAEGTHDFVQAYALSINAIFAEVALRLGWERLLQYAQRFGFGSDFNFDIDASVSRLKSSTSEISGTLLAETGFGQGELQATPLQMALVAQAVANQGVLMRPYLVAEIRGPDGQTIIRHEPRPFSRPMQPETARILRDMMVTSTRQGFAGPAALPGTTVAGKTGTAENAEGEPHAWYIGFAPAEEPRIAVAVVLENAGAGSTFAAPVAREIFRAALQPGTR